MDFEQLHHKASIVCPNGDRRAEGHFVDVINMAPHNRLAKQEERM